MLAAATATSLITSGNLSPIFLNCSLHKGFLERKLPYELTNSFEIEPENGLHISFNYKYKWR